MLASTELPGTCHAKSDSNGLSGESLDFSPGATTSHIVTNQNVNTSSTLKDPDNDYTKDQDLLWKSLEMDLHCDNGDNGQHNVNVEESLIERMTNNRWRVQQQHDKSRGSLWLDE